MATASGTWAKGKTNCASFGPGWGMASLSTQDRSSNFYKANVASFGNNATVFIDGSDSSGVWVWGGGELWVYAQSGGAPLGAAGGRPRAARPKIASTSVHPDGTIADLGCSASQPALCERLPACRASRSSAPTPPLTGVGVYYINPGAQAPLRVTCDMTGASGGWTLGFVENSVHVPSGGEYAGPPAGAVYANTGDLAISPASASALDAPAGSIET